MRNKGPMPAWLLWNLATVLVMSAALLVFGWGMPDRLRALFLLFLVIEAYGVWLWWSAPKKRVRDGDLPGQWRTPGEED